MCQQAAILRAMADVSPVVVSLVSLALLVLGVVTCVSLIRLSVYVRSEGRRYAIWPKNEDEQDQDQHPQSLRRRQRSTRL